jgi:predicted nucleic acid-binding Zn ribbon protein
MNPHRQPRRLGTAVRQALARAEPQTLLGAVQSAWPEAAGQQVAAEADPVSERDGVVTVACRSSTWAQELDLLQSELLSQLNETLARHDFEPSASPLRGLRFTADAARHFRS